MLRKPLGEAKRAWPCWGRFRSSSLLVDDDRVVSTALHRLVARTRQDAVPPDTLPRHAVRGEAIPAVAPTVLFVFSSALCTPHSKSCPPAVASLVRVTLLTHSRTLSPHTCNPGCRSGRCICHASSRCRPPIVRRGTCGPAPAGHCRSLGNPTR